MEGSCCCRYGLRLIVGVMVGLLLLLLPPSFAAPSFISDCVFDSHPSAPAAASRSLLQAKKPCPVNFEFMNYTGITTQCKGPKYPADLCCAAFKEFACPYVDEINDLTNDCASTMFSYINLNGNYPPGLFANECREGKQGLACPASSPNSSSQSDNASGTTTSMPPHPRPLLTLVAGIFFTSFHLF